MTDSSPPRRPSEEAVRAWTRLNRAQSFIADEIERRLKAAGMPPLSVYDVLLELSRAPDSRLRQVDLRKRLLFPQYSMSRLVDRLVQAGWVTLRPCPQDMRAVWIALTPEGRLLRETMWPIYGGAIADLVDAKLMPDEAATVARLLETVYKV